MTRLTETLAEAQLIFFDPDNGMAVKSCPPGKKDSSKYLNWNEAAAAFGSGKSVLIYQHFRRVERKAFVEAMASDFEDRMGCKNVIAFCTANVVFFLLVQGGHAHKLDRAIDKVADTWRTQIAVIRDPHQSEPASPKRQQDLQTGSVT